MSTPVYKRTQTNNRFATLSDNEHPGSPISEGLDQDAKQDDCNPKKRHGSAKFTINDMSGRNLCNVNLGFVEHANMVSMEELIEMFQRHSGYMPQVLVGKTSGIVYRCGEAKLIAP
eukprot:scpid91370/ scgid5279/ 